jgi:predicted dinucleotide-binding enzyme
MKIGIIGSGNMGRALGARLTRTGYGVTFGARNLAQAQAAARLAGGDALAGSNEAAAEFGEVLLWTMREPDPARVLADPAVLDGKIVVDLNNRDYAVEAQTGAWFDRAIAERLQANAPKARVVKAFNTIAMEAFDIPPADLTSFGAQTFLAGADATAKKVVGQIAQSLGFNAVDLGSGPAAMRAAEALGDLIRLLMIDGKRGASAHLVLTRLPDSRLGQIGERGDSTYR